MRKVPPGMRTMFLRDWSPGGAVRRGKPFERIDIVASRASAEKGFGRTRGDPFQTNSPHAGGDACRARSRELAIAKQGGFLAMPLRRCPSDADNYPDACLNCSRSAREPAVQT